uniref:Uncharacterized protein n=1 Tax=Anguilla anguilla TaxID=7936 RepID=A0A0E9TPT0_ANGAN
MMKGTNQRALFVSATNNFRAQTVKDDRINKVKYWTY